MKKHSKIFKLFLLILFVSFISSINANAQTKKISLQGFLKDANGKAVADGIQSLTFKIYTVASGGMVLWSETQDLKVVGGVYAAQLGSIVDISALAWDVPYFVGVTVQGIELSPRTELTYAPYSFGTNKAQEVVCSGALGDVKYSILSPAQFVSENGKCWVPMDGRDLDAGDKLRKLTGLLKIPNGSGVFLRGQEFPNGIDNDNSRDSNSPIGTFQDQAMQTHQHDFIGNTNSTGAHSHIYKDRFLAFNVNGGPFTARDGGGEGNATEVQGTGLSGEHSHTFTGTTKDNNGNSAPETRPKNLNFWTYIRIN